MSFLTDPTRKMTIAKIYLAIFALLALVISGTTFYLSRDLPSLSQLEEYRPKLVSKVYSADGKLIKEFFEEKRTFVPLDSMPSFLKEAAIATEDRRFNNHWGINLQRLASAVFIDIITLSKRQGASTITQQLARQLYLTLEKTVTRKIREALTAIQIERTYTKDEILEMYLNHMNFGGGAYGVQSASMRFFGKNARELNVQESATLIGMLQRPESYSPYKHPEACLARRNIVLGAMYDVGYLGREQYKSLTDSQLVVIESSVHEAYGIAPYFTEYIRQQLQEKYGYNLYTDGLQIYTTLDSRAQMIAEKYTRGWLKVMQRRVNRRMVRERQADSVFTKPLLEKLGKPLRQVLADTSLCDSVLTAKRPVQAALVSLDPRTGHIIAMIGGRDFDESKYNRAVQAARQPGSAFKPFVYTAVVDNGYPPTFEVLNEPTVTKLEDGTEWRPHNYDESFGGYVSLREALARSLNLPTVRLIQQITKPSVVVDYAHRMGLTTPIPAVDAIALGAGEVIPMEITSAYSSLANLGIRMEPIGILRVLDKDGNALDEATPHGKEVLRKETAYIMADMMRSSLDSPRGTSAGARSRFGFYRIAGGKTGTTNDYTDAWYIGFTPQICTGVWVGFDRQDMKFDKGETGASVALPIWAPYMRDVHDSLSLANEEFPVPDNVVRVEVCSVSKKPPTEDCPTTFNEAFNAGDVPTIPCPIHSGRKVSDRRRRIN
jgi:penicillin-binding protein 1A